MNQGRGAIPALFHAVDEGACESRRIPLEPPRRQGRKGKNAVNLGVLCAFVAAAEGAFAVTLKRDLRHPPL